MQNALRDAYLKFVRNPVNLNIHGKAELREFNRIMAEIDQYSTSDDASKDKTFHRYFLAISNLTIHITKKIEIEHIRIAHRNIKTLSVTATYSERRPSMDSLDCIQCISDRLNSLDISFVRLNTVGLYPPGIERLHLNGLTQEVYQRLAFSPQTRQVAITGSNTAMIQTIRGDAIESLDIIEMPRLIELGAVKELPKLKRMRIIRCKRFDPGKLDLPSDIELVHIK